MYDKLYIGYFCDISFLCNIIMTKICIYNVYIVSINSSYFYCFNCSGSLLLPIV